MEIGKIIKEERTKRQLTQEQLAQEFFVTRQLISKWENGKSYPDLEQVLQLSSFFDLSLDYLMREDHAMVEDFNTSIKGRKILKAIIFTLTSILLLILAGFIGIKMIEGPVLDSSNVEIVNIKKEVLPATQAENTATGEMVTLPEDVEYQIELKSKKWYIDLSFLQLHINRADEENVQIIVFGQYSFFPEAKERTLEVYSERDGDALDPTLKIDKRLWLFSFAQAKEENDDWGELLVDN